MPVPGLCAHPQGTLVERALAYLAGGPAGSEALTRDVLGLPLASGMVAERVVQALLGADPRVGRLADGRWLLVGRAGRSPGVDDCVFAVVDVETTGGMPGRGDRITEVAVAVVSGGGRELIYQSLVNPERPIPRAVSAVTQISDNMVREQPTFSDIADQVLAALAGRVFVAHNAGFDWRFLNAELQRARGLVLDGPRLCTVKLARRLLPGLKSRSLDSLALFFGIDIEQRHRAGPDALATAHLLGRLLPLAAERGVTTLHELALLTARRPQRKRTRRAHPESMGEA